MIFLCKVAKNMNLINKLRMKLKFSLEVQVFNHIRLFTLDMEVS